MSDTANTAHEKDPNRVGQPNIWFGADTCECICSCRMMAFAIDDKQGMCPRCYDASLKENI